jgi:hypothetical protein
MPSALSIITTALSTHPALQPLSRSSPLSINQPGSDSQNAFLRRSPPPRPCGRQPHPRRPWLWRERRLWRCPQPQGDPVHHCSDLGCRLPPRHRHDHLLPGHDCKSRTPGQPRKPGPTADTHIRSSPSASMASRPTSAPPTPAPTATRTASCT